MLQKWKKRPTRNIDSGYNPTLLQPNYWTLANHYLRDLDHLKKEAFRAVGYQTRQHAHHWELRNANSQALSKDLLSQKLQGLATCVLTRLPSDSDTFSWMLKTTELAELHLS